jgi:hypothetical protein
MENVNQAPVSKKEKFCLVINKQFIENNWHSYYSLQISEKVGPRKYLFLAFAYTSYGSLKIDIK